MLGKPSFGGVSKILGYVFLAVNWVCVLVDYLVAGVWRKAVEDEQP